MMPRIADVLERESRTVDLGHGDFERLLGRRERKQRNRRIRAGALGVLVTLAVGMVLARSLTSPQIPADRTIDRGPAPAPAGTLAYILDADVYVASPDGSNAIKIADGVGEECVSTEGFTYGGEGSMWSPDGRYLAYRRGDCSREDDRGEVVISDATGNVLATFPADGWDIGWSPDSSRVAVWDTYSEKVAVYGVDGTRHALVTMPSWWSPFGDHDPAWLDDGTLAVDDAEIPPDGGAVKRLDTLKVAEWADDYAVTVGARVVSPDGSHTAEVRGRSLTVDGSTILRVERGTFLNVIDFSPEGDRLLYSTRGEDVSRPKLWSIGIDGSDPRVIVAGTIDGDWFVPSVLDDTPADPSVDG